MELSKAAQTHLYHLLDSDHRPGNIMHAITAMRKFRENLIEEEELRKIKSNLDFVHQAVDVDLTKEEKATIQDKVKELVKKNEGVFPASITGLAVAQEITDCFFIV